ncbi:hypothetical protein [Caudoviricetes sp.]|nr:hypothetical protein [Caudoviricetes sp.]
MTLNNEQLYGKAFFSKEELTRLGRGEEVILWKFEGAKAYARYDAGCCNLYLRFENLLSIERKTIKNLWCPEMINIALPRCHEELRAELIERREKTQDHSLTPIIDFLYRLMLSSPEPCAPQEEVGVKHDEGKLQYFLIPYEAIQALATVVTFGAKKYQPNNWKLLADPEERYENALWRHLMARKGGEKNDPETGYPHLWHAITNLAFLIYFECKDGNKGD